MNYMRNLIKRFCRRGKEESQRFPISDIICSKAGKVFMDTTKRPSSEQALVFTNKDIITGAKEMSYPLYPETMRKITKVHGLFMPVVESMIINLLKDEEKRLPNYYVFARDGEL